MFAGGYTEINTEFVLRAVNSQPSMSFSEFFDKSLYYNIAKGNYNVTRLTKTIDSLTSIGFVEVVCLSDEPRWKITPKGKQHLIFLESVYMLAEKESGSKSKCIEDVTSTHKTNVYSTFLKLTVSVIALITIAWVLIGG